MSSRYDYLDPGQDPEYCNRYSIDIEDERADEARDARDRADEAEAAAAKAEADDAAAREFPMFRKSQTPAA